MSNGQPNGSKGLIPVLRPTMLISPEEYAANQTKIAHIRQLAATMEQNNEQAHQRYVQLELQKRVEEGLQAQQLLASMSQPGNQPVVTPSLPAITGHVYQGQQNRPQIIPTTARIEEVPSSVSSQVFQQAGPSTIRASTNSAASRNQSAWQAFNSPNQPSSNASKFGETLQGRWQTNLSQPQQQPPSQLQGRAQWRAQQQTPLQQSQLQQSQLQQSQLQQLQQQQQLRQRQQQPNPQQLYVQPQRIQYEQASISAPMQLSQPASQPHPGQEPSQPVTIPVVNTSSSLEGALGDQGSRMSPLSSNAASASFVQPIAAVQQSDAKPQHADNQSKQSIDKDVLVADGIRRIGPNYVSNMVATAQASTTPTRTNRVAVAATSRTSSPSITSQSSKMEAIVSLESPAPTSPAQVRSNTRHITAQRSSDTPSASAIVSAAPPTVPASSSNSVSHTSKINSNASTVHFPSPSANLSKSYKQPLVGSNDALSPLQQRMALWNSSSPGPVPSLAEPRISQRTAPVISSSNMEVQTIVNGGPMTPTNQPTKTSSSPRTPASANKKYLARDILRSLGGSGLLNGKRKRSEEPPTVSKRGRTVQGEQQNVDIGAPGSVSSFSGQDATLDALPVSPGRGHAQREEEEEEEVEVENEIALSENMKLSAPRTTANPPSVPSVTDEIIDISDDESFQKESSLVKRSETQPLAAPVSLPFPPTETVPSKTKEPLFLPSPSSSPRSTRSLQYQEDHPILGKDNSLENKAPWDMPSIDTLDDPVAKTLALRSRKTNMKGMEVYVLIPPPPDWVKRANQTSQVRDKQQNRDNAKRKPRVNKAQEEADDSEDEIEHWYIDGGNVSKHGQEAATGEADEKRRQAEAAEQQEVMSLTSSLLRKQPCEWRHCDVVMNTIDGLSKHLARHVHNKPGPYVCLWQNCVRRFSEEARLLVHLESHVRKPVLCPYQDCDLSYRTPRDLVAHCKLEHDNDKHRLGPKPFKPTLISMPPVPLTLPSYMVVPRDIRQTPISKDRHNSLGPWVLRNIFGPVTLEVRRPNAAVPMRNLRSVMDKEDSNGQAIASDEYDFLRPKSPSSTPKAQFDDLASTAVSGMIHAGLTFWGPEPPEEDIKVEISPPDVVESFDITRSGDLAMDGGGQENKDPNSREEATAEPSSIPDPSAEHPTATQESGLSHVISDSGVLTKPTNDTNCLLV